MRRSVSAVHVLAFVSAGLVFCSAPVLSGAINGSAGRGSDGLGINGGNFEAKGPYSRVHLQSGEETPNGSWTFRFLENRAIQFPDFFSSVTRSKSKRLNAAVWDGALPDQEVQAKDLDIHDWYKEFAESAVNDFVPLVRGGISAKIRIARAGVESIAFYNYSYEIPFERTSAYPPPPREPEADNEKRLKDSIISALKKVCMDPALALPQGLEAVEVKMIFAGDPSGAKGWWRNDLIGSFHGHDSPL